MKVKKHSKLSDREVEYEFNGETEVDLKHSDKEKEMLIKNKMAMTAFTMAFWDNHDQYCVAMVLNSKTKEWPSGQTWEINQEFAPTEMLGEAEQQRESCKPST